jgi:adenine-specific DNA-methyltransferase
MDSVLNGTSQYSIIHGDCLDVMRTFVPNSIDLIATDPPYYRVKGEDWDRQWDNPKAFLSWMSELCKEWHRILKPNGSIYVFASPQMAARVEVEMWGWFNVLNHITWRKEQARHKQACKEVLRGYFPQSERIIFAEHVGSDNIAKGEAGYAAKCDELHGFVFEPLRAYLDSERKRAGIGKDECNEACGFSRTAGGMASRHYFSQSQWCLPTEEHYAAMQLLFNASCNGSGPQYLRSEYEDLRREYEDLRREYEDLRRPFSVTADVQYTDVWDFSTVNGYQGKHPCEKPVALMEHIIQTSSREGAVVLDCFVGSGSTGEACRNLGRRFIGIEKDDHWACLANKRIEQAAANRQTELIASNDCSEAITEANNCTELVTV